MKKSLLNWGQSLDAYLRGLGPNHARHDADGSLWRIVGRPLVTIAIAILVAVAIVRGEIWAIRQAPLLITNTERASLHDAACVPDDNADDGVLPVAVLR